MKRVIPFLFLFAALVLVVGIAIRVIAQSSTDKIKGKLAALCTVELPHESKPI